MSRLTCDLSGVTYVLDSDTLGGTSSAASPSEDLQASLDPGSQIRFGHLSAHDRQHRPYGVHVGGGQFDAVEAQERGQYHEGRTLVPTDVRMVLQQAEPIGSGQLRQPDPGRV